ncbi:hypothetical protein [Vibrio sp. SCSIO 43137]|uniref:hypothetical protein n=1 Tax=Vibrio sp. SCSIO 43137 TaxID=3021011 RepID=UPI0023079DF5|nr:hypothetical protein [Vibrio sp. SCSIO 43137]WCE29371.1 hypothetical protein PK654_13755 [Vibrio sp. SCSIO 43137]
MFNNNTMFITGLMLATFSFPAISADNPVQILKFKLDEVEICDKEENCDDVARKTLPDTKTEPLLVEAVNAESGFLMFTQNGIQKWVHQTEVELNVKAIASVTCTAQNHSRKSDSDVYASMGLGECK